MVLVMVQQLIVGGLILVVVQIKEVQPLGLVNLQVAIHHVMLILQIVVHQVMGRLWQKPMVVLQIHVQIALRLLVVLMEVQKVVLILILTVLIVVAVELHVIQLMGKVVNQVYVQELVAEQEVAEQDPVEQDLVEQEVAEQEVVEQDLVAQEPAVVALVHMGQNVVTLLGVVRLIASTQAIVMFS